MRGSSVSCSVLALLFAASGCMGEDPDEASSVPTTGIPLPTSGPAETTADQDSMASADAGPKLDVGMGSGGLPCEEGGDCGECVPS
ncbi:MAG: hypothetical protein AB1Z98_12630, partial [Nannocystaceae bacterium]